MRCGAVGLWGCGAVGLWGGGVAMVWQWCGNGVAMVWQGCGKGVARVWQWCGKTHIVANDRVSEVLHVQPELVAASSVRGEPHERGVAALVRW